MNILVTGGAGFIGSAFVRYLLNRYPDYRVVVFDKLTYAGNLDNLKTADGNPQYAFVRGDICDRIALRRVLAEHRIDAIVNYAAETHVDRSIHDSSDFLQTDVFGTRELLEAVKALGIKKMIQISTDEVYGSIDAGAFTEESPFRPNSPYAASKVGGDLLCRAYHETYGVPVAVTHSCNVYGSHQYPEKIIPLFVTNLLEGKKVPLYGDGKNVREWIHTDDHCRAIDIILHRAAPGAVYNIGTGDEIQNVALTAKILALLGVGEEMIERVADRPGHDRRYAIDCTRLKTELGWAPAVPFDEGLAATVAWYRDNEDWWRKIKSGEYRTYYEQNYGQRG
jgi:dTDP-glucose 4,6-dehydratase